MKNLTIKAVVASILLAQIAANAQVAKIREPMEIKKARTQVSLDNGTKAEQQKLIIDFAKNLLGGNKGLEAIGAKSSGKQYEVNAAKFNQSIETGYKVTYGAKGETAEAVDIKSNVKNILALSEKGELTGQNQVGADLYIRTVEMLSKNSGEGDNVSALFKFMQVWHDVMVKSTGESPELTNFNDVGAKMLAAHYKNAKSLDADVAFRQALKEKLGSDSAVDNFIARLKACLKALGLA